ncbi:hypothetical protein [Natronobacterium texcoconense]|uniref:Uncharacterized protein n=1 Tax=Natronobacterium texcoconense TaxID=1095778 RepID=A0A1H1ETJ3_NATTX|nr:hypothetical protein [Natronobacterium texcoconense]SDQ91878.1 hypothetical protein SAMN04489842_1689 [Natronobacterium texcoconense]
MKTLEVTEEQHAFIQHVREELSEEVVGRYGHVRDQDAVQFLIDNVDTDGNGEVSLDDAIAGEADTSEFTYDSDTDEEEAGDDADDTEESEGGEADDDDMLDEMMSLLETHDDKWGEASSEEARYEVELPDGSTEEVQTKDDVRALLFKNYR